MPSVRCSVSLLNDKSRTVDIEIKKEKGGELLWQVLKSAGGSLRLAALNGTWETNFGDILSLWEQNAKRKVQNLVTLVVFDIKQDFYEDIIGNGKAIVSENAGLYNDNPSEKDGRRPSCGVGCSGGWQGGGTA